MGIVLSGLLAGLLHVLSGPDHLTVVAPYAALDRRGAWRIGLRWGIGHSGGVLLVGLLTLLLRGVLPVERLSGVSERLVGVILLVIGVWAIYNARRIHPEQFHESAPAPQRHAAFGVGIVHGLAGSSHLLGVLPALALPSTLATAAYLILFGVGTVVGMIGFATVLGWTAGTLLASARGVRLLLTVCGVAAISVGIYWLVA